MVVEIPRSFEVFSARVAQKVPSIRMGENVSLQVVLLDVRLVAKGAQV
jgi:hypothetical protein